jgi:hypothetical protein
MATHINILKEQFLKLLAAKAFPVCLNVTVIVSKIHNGMSCCHIYIYLSVKICTALNYKEKSSG